MKKTYYFAIIVLLIFVYKSAFANMDQYCAVPPFLSQNVAPNVLIVQDVSGSMVWSAYNPDSYGMGYCGDVYNDYDTNGNIVNCPSSYNKNQTYEGYFIPTDVYTYDPTNNFWYINNSATSKSCPSSVFADNFPYNSSGYYYSYNSYTGNCLNFLLMSRSDLVKWTMTGGEPKSCANGNTYSNSQCDPILNTSDIISADGETGVVMYPSINLYYDYDNNQYGYPNNSPQYIPNWVGYVSFSVLTPMPRINQAILPSLQNMSSNLRPRIGLLMFTTPLNSSDQPYTIPQTVYIGGYPYNQQTLSQPSNFSSSLLSTNPYTYIMRYMNYQMPLQGTPTGPALQDVIDYFSQNNPTYSYGFRPGRGTWMDPLYVCSPYTNANQCQAAPCAQNYVILMSDGGWDIPDCSINSDPVSEAYTLHTGGQNGSLRNDFSGITIQDLYAIYLGNLGTQNYQWTGSYGTIYGQNALENIAYFGSFEPLNSVSSSSFPSSSCTDNTDCQYQTAQGSLCTAPPSTPNTFFAPNNASQIKESLLSAFLNITKQASSASSVASISQKTQSGSSSIQAIFYPQKIFDNNTSASWIGYLYDWWLYNAVGSTTSNILNNNTPNYLEPTQDYTLNFVFQNNQLLAQEYSSNGNLVNTVSIDQLNPLWEAGKILWNTLPSQRTIYTTDGVSLVPFTASNVSNFENYLNINLPNDSYLCNTNQSCSLNTAATNLVNYILGQDLTGARSRTVNIGGNSNVWKLGDIMYSTPQAVQYTNWIDPSQSFNVVYVGANDGMLHAFLAGQVQNINLPDNAVAKLCANDDSSCPQSISLNGHTYTPGSELWGFIPLDSLPYLKYLANPNYCHIYYQDLTPYIFRANGHIILIGGMRMGGATSETTQSGFIQTPSIAGQTINSIGLSAYYALDITNPFKPEFLWEFTSPGLGFSFSGPAVINVNGQYFVMFLTGPTDYNGNAGLALKAFVLSLNSDFTENSKYTLTVDPSLKSAFGGRLFTQGIVDDSTGNTIAVPFGVSIENGNTWSGGVYMLFTNNSTDPNSWTFQKIMTTKNPITAKVAHMSCFNKTYIFFGSGKFFYPTDDYNPNNADKLYGVDVTSCLAGGNCNINAAHSSNSSCQELTSPGGGLNSWYISLDNSQSNGYLKERDISDPTVTGQNVVFFTTTEPTSNLCGFGGRTRVWGLNCATGAAALDSSCPGYVINNIKGTLLLQTSTGAVEQINPNTTFTTGNPVTSWQTGVSPETSTTFVAPFTGQAGIIIQWKKE
jgi:type IV pilus assembly protein PilY1